MDHRRTRRDVARPCGTRWASPAWVDARVPSSSSDGRRSIAPLRGGPVDAPPNNKRATNQSRAADRRLRGWVNHMREPSFLVGSPETGDRPTSTASRTTWYGGPATALVVIRRAPESRSGRVETHDSPHQI